MRLDPYVIRPHSDNEKNSLLNAINIELGPKTPQWTILTQIGQQNLEFINVEFIFLIIIFIMFYIIIVMIIGIKL